MPTSLNARFHGRLDGEPKKAFTVKTEIGWRILLRKGSRSFFIRPLRIRLRAK